MKGDKKQVFFNTYKQVTKSGVVNSKRKEQKNLEEVLNLEQLLVYQMDTQLLVLKNHNKKKRPSGYVNVEKEGDKLKIKFRFFKYNKGARPTVSTKVYEAIIS